MILSLCRSTSAWVEQLPGTGARGEAWTEAIFAPILCARSGSVQANQYLERRAAACRQLARRERQPEMAKALLDLADVYERQLECGSPGQQQQMR